MVSGLRVCFDQGRIVKGASGLDRSHRSKEQGMRRCLDGNGVEL
jgi:hypothetical protein